MIFLEAIEKPSAKERTAYLDEACRDDPGLREELESLLEAHENAGGFLKSPLLDLDVTLDTSPITEGPGTTIGNYKLLEQIGEGGMAVVYMAEQEKPLRRRVALKIIKLGMDTKQVIARFEVERQALAIMEHPNIAKVFDAGTTGTGRPYFVMELVRGVSITAYCDKNKLTTEARLDLFVQVCNAVQHAHQKGIIHRDIKPSNVMVTLHDGKPVPKVIDFGIAKATSQRLTEKTLFTRYAQMIGTPAYMSPEQAEMSGLDIDTRADIYSLGILLYELLTGVTPFSEEQLREAGYLEMQRIICEQEPVKPSTRLSTLGDTLTDVAEHRKASPDLLQKLVRGDLDWIVMKSLEKDRTRRYNAAAEMVADIARHINHEPVLAGPPSQIYRLRKFIRRHRTHAIGAAIVAVFLAGMTVISAMYIQAHNRGEEAESLRHKEVLSKAMEFRSKGQFQDAMNKVETMLSSKHVGPEARLLRARLILELHGPTDAVKELEELIKERDEIACQAHLLLARIYLESDPGDPKTTKQYQQKAKGHQQEGEKLFSESADAYCLRAMTAGTVQETLVLLNKAIELDHSHYTSLKVRALTYYALRDYRNMERDAVAMTTLRDWDSLGYSLMAIALRRTEDFTDAIERHNKAIRISPDNPELYDERRQTYMQMGNYKQALSDAQECVKLQPNENTYHFHVFFSHAALGRYEDAKAKYATITEEGPKAKRQFDRWAMREVFNILGAGQRLDLPEHKTGGVAFWPLHEAANYYRELSAKGERLVTRGMRAAWSPDGTELAYSRGFPGANGIEVLHLESRETRLLTIPGKDPVWSPDRAYIAFVRERQVQRLAEVAGESGRTTEDYSQEEIWIIKPNGEELRHLAKGGFPTWSNDSRRVFYQSRLEGELFSVTVDDPNAQPKSIMRCNDYYPAVSPDEKYVSYEVGRSLQIVELVSGSRAASWSAPPGSGGLLTSWSPNGRELSVGGYDWSKLGLWIYELDSKKATKVLNGPVTLAAWSPDGNHIAFDLRDPYFEIWIAELNSDMSTIEALGPGRTLDGHYQDLVDQYTRVIKSDPDNSEAYHQRAHLHESFGQWREAVKDFTRAIEGKPYGIHLYEERADVYLRLQEYEKAAAGLEQYAKFLESGGHPTQASMNKLADSMNELARLLATSPKAELRNGTTAIEIATKACELTSRKNSGYMDTLAAAYAEAGDFDEAINRQQKAIDLLDGEQGSRYRPECEARLELYGERQPYHRQPLFENQMIAHWTFDRVEGKNVLDSSGNGLHGELMGDAQIVSDPQRNSVLSLDGDEDYVDCGNSLAFDMSRQVTVSAWIKVHKFDTQWQAIVTKGSSAWRLRRYNLGSSVAFMSGTNPDYWLEGIADVNDGKWHHVVGVHDGTRMCLYLDGELDVSASATGSIDSNGDPVCIGSDSVPGRFWNGLIDDVRIYSYALSEAEVKELCAGRGPGPNKRPE